MKSESINSYVEIKQKTDRDVRQLGVLVSESYEAESTDQQTVINLNMSVDINNKKQVWVFIDGAKLIEGATGNYTFTNIVNNVSAQITLNAPLIAGLAIQAYKLGAYQESFPNPSSVTATLLNDVAQPHKMATAAFTPFVAKTLITAPNTTIVNRAQVEAASLKAIAGIERVICRSIVLSRTEFGSSGEPVYELDSKDSRVRFIGTGWVGAANSNGTRIETGTVSDFLEFSYYGTGINLLTGLLSGAMDARLSIDGPSEIGTNIFPASFSTILATRNYNPNQILPLVSSQVLGWHTVKIRNNNSAGLEVYGFEILNQRTDLAVLSGVAYGGMKQEVLAALSASAFNAGVTGTRGARVIKYLQNNVISQAVTNVNTASAFLTSADHTNEEVVRRINFKEFGANRADDASTLTTTVTTNIAFTLDDGTTTLVGYQVRDGGSGGSVSNSISPYVSGAFFTINFVGTGLDIFCLASFVTQDTYSLTVDGVSQGNLTTMPANALPFYLKICSGLPYGTHTVKITRTTIVNSSTAFADFIIYQPKKPVIPTGAIEVADYNVMADFISASSAGTYAVSTQFIGQGVLRKSAMREFAYVGSWTTGIDIRLEAGYSVNTGASGAYMEYTFWGTGFQAGLLGFNLANNSSFTVDGLALNAGSNIGSTISLLQEGTGLTLSAAGVLTGTPSVANPMFKVMVSGLALGRHTIRITHNTAATSIYLSVIDIITPIHMNNTKVGSLSLKDSRVFSPIVDKPNVIDLSKAKAWVVYDQANSKILASYNVSQCLAISTGYTIIYFEKQFKNKNYITIGTALVTDVQGGVVELSKQTQLSSIQYVDYNGVLRNETISVVFFGELENEIDE